MDTRIDSDDDVVILSAEEVRRLVDAEARSRMGISGEEFLKRRAQGVLPDTLAANDIAILASLLDVNGRADR